MEKKQITISIKGLVIFMIIAILIIAVVIMGIHIMNQDKALKENDMEISNVKEVKETQQTQNVQSSKIQEISINSDLVKKLYGYINNEYEGEFYPKFDVYTLLSYYRNQKMDTTNLEDDIKLMTVLDSLMNDKTYTVIKNADLKTEYEGDWEYKSIKMGENYYYDYETQTYKHRDATTYGVSGDVIVFSMENIQKKANDGTYYWVSSELANKNELNIITTAVSKDDLYGHYSYSVPTAIKQEMGHYYDEVYIEFKPDGRLSMNCVEGQFITGGYYIEDSKIICGSLYIEGDNIQRHHLEERYVFEQTGAKTLKLVDVINDRAIGQVTQEPYVKIGSTYTKE